MSLYEIKPTELINFDQDSLLTDVISRIKQHPQWSDNYNGLLHHDSLTMILSIYTFLFGKNAESFDKKIRENFMTTARSDEAKAYSIRENNILFKQNTESVVTLKGTITNRTLNESIFIPTILLNSIGLNSKKINFEIINKTDGVYNYRDDIEITAGLDINSFLIDAYAGETFRHTYSIQERREAFSITVPYTPIIQDSIQVYFYLNGAYFPLFEDTLDNSERQISNIFPDGVPKYSIKYTFDNKPIITFGKENFGGTFKKAHTSGEIVIYGRIGGGSASNIPVGSLSQDVAIDYNGEEYIINFTNISSGTSGTDADSLDDVILYAPLNRGRGKNVIDKYDAEGKIKNYVNKMIIEIPSYKEESKNNVPLLHNYYYIVPKRNFSNFILPTPLATDTIEGYNQIINDTFNKFCNVYGNHDSTISEISSGFLNDNGVYDFKYLLSQRSVLSNSLKVEAYSNDKIIDTIVFEGNYPLLKTINNKFVDGNAVYTTKKFTNDTIFIGTATDGRLNNRFQIMFDDHDFLFDIDIFTGSGTYTYETLVETLNLAIKAIINASLNPTILGYVHDLYVTRNYAYVTYNDDNSISFNSPKTGDRSKIKFVGVEGTPQFNFCYDLGITPESYRAERSNIIFKSENSIFDYTKNEVIVSINTDKMEILIEEDVDVIQGVSNPAGPLLMFNLYDDFLEQQYKVQEGNDLTVEFWDATVKKDEVIFKGLSYFSPLSSGTQTSNYTGNIVKTANDCKLNIDTSILTLQLKDPEQLQPYIAGYAVELGDIVNMLLYKVEGVTKTLIQSFNAQPEWEQVSNYALGTIINLPLTVSNTLELGKNYVVDIYTKLDAEPNVLAESIEFNVIVTTITNGVGSNNKIQHEDNVSFYDRAKNLIVINTVDGVEDVDADPVSFAGFSNFEKVLIKFKAKTYDNISFEYNCNPYNPEGEAFEILNKISNKNVKLLGLENIIKDINFIPIGFDVDVYVRSGFSKVSAKEFVYNQIVNNFKYNNTYEDYQINELVNNNDLSSIIMPYAGDFGITNVLIRSGTFRFIEPQNDLKNYYFILDSNLLNYIKNIESNYANILGVSDNYKITVNVI